MAKKETKKEIKPLSKEQMAELKNIIKQAPQLTVFAKKTLLCMIGKSENLTKPIILLFGRRFKKLGREVAHGAHDINSTGYSTRVDLFLKEAGSPMIFSCIVGPQGDVIKIWIAPEFFDRSAEEITLNISTIKRVKL